MVTEIGKMIAIQAEDGHVYIGFVTGVNEHGQCTVDVVADRTYRSAAAAGRT